MRNFILLSIFYNYTFVNAEGKAWVVPTLKTYYEPVIQLIFKNIILLSRIKKML